MISKVEHFEFITLKWNVVYFLREWGIEHWNENVVICQVKWPIDRHSKPLLHVYFRWNKSGFDAGRLDVTVPRHLSRSLLSRSFNRREVATIAATTRHGRQFANRSLHARMEENIRGWVSLLDWIGLDFILIMDRPLRVNHRVHYHRYYHRWSFRLNTYWIFVFVFHLYHCSSIAQLRHLSMPKFA